MPFTFSHPALVLPVSFLPGKWYSLTGLIIGSMAPDFEYFLRMRILSEISHSVKGIFLFCIPAALIISFIFHDVVRNSLIKNLPAPLAGRFVKYIRFNWNLFFRKSWFIVIISILMGVLSHLLWDSFTHADGYFVERVSLLNYELTVGHMHFPVFKLVQHASSLAGGVFILFYIWKMPVSKIEKQKINNKYWISVIGIAIVIVLIKLFSDPGTMLLGNLVVTTISAGMISLIVTSAFIQNKL